MSDVKGKTGAVLRETAVLTGAVAIIAAAVYFFLVPSHASVSSISGLGIVLSNFVPLPLSVITMILNVVLLIIGFFTCGREFGAKTVYTSVLLPVFLGLLERLFPDFGSMTGSQELDVLCYILVVSIGLSILFNRNASSGGLDIVAKVMNKYLHIELGRAMSLSGMCVALSAALVYDKKTVVLSILGTYFNGIVLDHFIFDNSIKRRVCIITEKEEALRQFIINDLHSGATMYEAIGAYNLEKHNEIITIVDKSEYQKLIASAQIDFNGEKLSLSQLGAYKENAKRDVRRAAYEAESGFYMAHGDELDRIFDSLVKCRTRIAKELGFNTFTELAYCRQTRNCYDAKDVSDFRSRIVRDIVPVVCRLKDICVSILSESVLDQHSHESSVVNQ